MDWIYISPHFDDVALSCGGLVWQQAQDGLKVSIWTICGGEPTGEDFSPVAEFLHQRWKTGAQAVSIRRAEDLASCAQMGASARHFPIPDCIYRRGAEGQFLYPSFEAIRNAPLASEAHLIQQLSQMLAQGLPPEAEVVCPLALGDHVDHRLTRAAVEQVGRCLWYYADFPYVLEETERLEQLTSQGWKAVDFPLPETALSAWQKAVAAHASQISTFWDDLTEMEAAIKDYFERYRGVRLWQKPT